MSSKNDYATFGVCIGCFILTALILAVLLNGMVIYGLAKYYKQLDFSGIIVLSLSISDITAPICAYPLSAYSSLQAVWKFGDNGCYWYGFVTTLTGLCSINHLMLLSIERYITLVLPLRREELLDKTKVLVAIAFCWIFSFCWAIAPVFGWSEYRLEGIKTMCSINWQSRSSLDFAYNILLFILCFLVQEIVIIFCHQRTLREVKKMTLRAVGTHGSNSQTYLDLVKVEKQQFFVVLFMVMGFNFAWLPYAITSLMIIMDLQHLVSPIAESLPAMFAKSAVVYNPLIYFVSNKLFRLMLCGRNVVVTPSELE
uniref:C-like opsin n=1 Tax=Tripedalia cystophora TaxID=6141 RepID=A0A059NTC7_TRICY|nr:c-like opsin [Tripedalia cystophora]